MMFMGMEKCFVGAETFPLKGSNGQLVLGILLMPFKDQWIPNMPKAVFG